MPELPEVETIKNELLFWVAGQRVTQVNILDAKLVHGISVEEFRRRLIGQMVDVIGRRGKYLIFYLASDQSLIMHLRMTGVLLLNPKKADRYARADLQFSNGVQLVFSDRRRLGVMWLVKYASDIVGKLGPEPLFENFTPYVLAQTLSEHRIPIKAALIDQSLVAGIGNMYADEALFAANIHPFKKADSLSPEQIKNLYSSILKVLRSAINNKGASVDTYVRPEGELGTAHFGFKVAHRGGKTCPVCGTAIQRVVVRNRGSYFCPRCQPD